MVRSPRRCLAPLFPVLLLAGCGGGPPSDVVTAEITRAVYAANMAMFAASKDNADVVGIEVGEWREETMPGGGPTLYEATWRAKLRFKEPIATVLAEIDGKNLVKVVADKGEELPFEGRCGGGESNGKWDLGANAQSKDNDILGAGAWQPIIAKVEGLKAGYPVIQNGMQTSAKFRQHNFEPLSKLAPCVVEGSAEHKEFEAAAAERAKKAQEVAAEQARKRQEEHDARQRQAREEAEERQRKHQEEQARLAAEAAERQEKAQEEHARKQAEATEASRVAREAAQKKAADDRHARLLAVLKPLQSPDGAVVVAEAGPTLGTVVLDAAIDEQKLAVTGHAVDLRSMPFRDFTFEGAVDERGAFTFKSSLGGDAVVYGQSGDKLAARGSTIQAIESADRKKLDELIALGKRLSAEAPKSLQVETLDGEAAKTREPTLQLAGLSGSVFFRGRLDPRVTPLFAADLAGRGTYAWKNKEVVSVRLAEPVRGKGIFVRGTAAPSTEMIVTINGVHQVTVPSIPKAGSVVIALPADLDVLEVRFEATGSVTARTIGLVK